MSNQLKIRTEFQDPNWGADKLGQIPVLHCFNKDELKVLYSLGTIKSVKASTNIIIEGEPTRGLYILLEGTVSIHKTDPFSGTLHRIAFLEEGSYFGELSLFDKAPRSATVIAESHCFLFHLEADTFTNSLRQSGQTTQVKFYESCLQSLCDRLRKLNADYITSQNLLWKHALRKDEAVGKAKRVQ